ncbi:MAG TPA: helix-turn-helix transcriptional regulator [Longimicrobiales bacterium]|nr:helix-turn-helix transcriptional regulator [Longimicrobiales bacterium]
MARIDVIPGTLELLLLKVLSPGREMHGFEILQWIRDHTDGELLIEEGALYPALHRMEERRLIRGEWLISEKGRRARYYTVSARGRAELLRAETAWRRYVHAWEKIALAAAAAS